MTVSSTLHCCGFSALSLDATRLHTFPSSHPVSYPPQRSTLQPLHQFEICKLEDTQLDASYTPDKANPYAVNTQRVTGQAISKTRLQITLQSLEVLRFCLREVVGLDVSYTPV